MTQVSPNEGLIPMRVVHHARFDPVGRVGGVHSFALGLRRIFEAVDFTTPKSDRMADVVAQRIPVICDNQGVCDWPRDYPVIGFRHGVAAEKVLVTHNWTDTKLAFGQWRAAKRPNVVWVACASWIREASERWYKSPTSHVIYHPIDTERFDARLDNNGSRLILHDARGAHKGQHLIPALQRAFPDWRFEALACEPNEVPNRMRNAAGFIHLSRYEGNSIVCCEAMAMNLPCLFTNVGLMRDPSRMLDVNVVDARRAFFDATYLVEQVRTFLNELPHGQRQPREWILANATLGHVRNTWQAVLADWHRLG